MENRWFDPFGLRGSRLDPFAQSAQRVATALAQALVGRPVRLERTPPVETTVDAVHELTPADPLDAVPGLGAASIPLWRRFRARLGSVRIGDRILDGAEIDVTDVRVVGPVNPRLRVARIEATARLTRDQLGGWLAELDVPWHVGLVDGRLEVTAARAARWVGVELRARAGAGTVTFETGAVRLLGRRFTPPGFLRRTVTRPAPWLPARFEVDTIEVVDDGVEVRGTATDLDWPIDAAEVLAELTATSPRSVLRVVSAEW